MNKLLLFTFALFQASVIARSPRKKGCIQSVSYTYSGTHSRTASGFLCQRWDSDTPHKPKKIPTDDGHHNYCRNPDKDIRGTWCYTTNPKVRWEHCEISKCDNDAEVIWNSIDLNSRSSFYRIQADPELVVQQSEYRIGVTNTKKRLGIEEKDSKYWHLEADYENKLLYFTDVKKNYIGMFDVSQQKIRKRFNGLAASIEAFTRDPVSGNLYWTDSTMGSVVVSDKSLTYYAPVYKTKPYTPYGIAVHAEKRLLIFCEYIRKNTKMIDTKIISTDLAGNNKRVLFRRPDVNKAIAIAVDYEDDRIFWIDQFEESNALVSGSMTGTNMKKHFEEKHSEFADLAIFSDYVYITDAKMKLNMVLEDYFNVKIYQKASGEVLSYTLHERPTGISIYAEPQNGKHTSSKKVLSHECVKTKCSHICLPRIGKYKGPACVCSIGYLLKARTKKCVKSES